MNKIILKNRKAFSRHLGWVLRGGKQNAKRKWNRAN
jgi:hypothetical protein